MHLLDDLNTPKAIAEMHALKHAAGRKALAGTLAFFGFRANELRQWQQSQAPATAIARGEVESRSPPAMPPARQRTGRNPTASATNSPRMGIVLKDSKDGTTWEVAR